MKRIFIFLGLMLWFGLESAWAQCQLCHLKQEQAQKAVEYLRLKGEIVLYAGCANGDIARKLNINQVNYRPVRDRLGYYEIFVDGIVTRTFDIQDQRPANVVETEMRFADVIDIAYVHVRTSGYQDMNTGRKIWDATCLGIYLGYDCDPCIDPFDYPYEPVE